MMTRFADRVAVVTGGARRTGRAVSLRLAEEGAAVAIVSRTPRALEPTVGAIREGGRPAVGILADVGIPDDARRIAREVEAAFGRADFLVNAAGIYLPGEFPSYPYENWKRTLDTYLSGPFLVTQSLLPLLERPPGGHVVNLSSTIAEEGLPGFEAYCAGKGGIEAMTRALAHSLEPRGVKVSVLIAGQINAEGTSPEPDTKLETADVADAIVYLLSLPSRVYLRELVIKTRR